MDTPATPVMGMEPQIKRPVDLHGVVMFALWARRYPDVTDEFKITRAWFAYQALASDIARLDWDTVQRAAIVLGADVAHGN